MQRILLCTTVISVLLAVLLCVAVHYDVCAQAVAIFMKWFWIVEKLG
jgi:hypothetical protein